MTEPETKTETEDFSDELCDESLDRVKAEFCECSCCTTLSKMSLLFAGS